MSANRSTLALTLATALGLAGCGSSGSSGSQPTPAASPGAKTRAIDSSAIPAASTVGSTHAQFVAFADAINLRSQDLAGFVGKPKGAKHGSQLVHGLKDKAHYERCLGVGKETKPIFKRSSENFERVGGVRYLSASSEVQVARTRATAEKELTIARQVFENPKKRGCLAAAFDAMLGGGHTIHTHGHAVGITIRHTHVASVPIGSAASGTGGGFGMSLTMDLTYSFSVRGRAFTVPGVFSFDSLNFILGRASVGLTTMAFGGPFPAEREASLFSLLVAHARDASRQSPAIIQ